MKKCFCQCGQMPKVFYSLYFIQKNGEIILPDFPRQRVMVVLCNKCKVLEVYH
jgi:hypothetical protein